MDTGCPKDLISGEQAQDCQAGINDAKAFNFNTANGSIVSTTRLNMSVPLLKYPMSAFILPNTPSVLSVGGRNRMGNTCIWQAGKKTMLDYTIR